jgi:hypothetical protein
LIKERIVDITHSIENRGTTLMAGLASPVQNFKVGSILGATATIIPSQLLAIVSFDDDVISATTDNEVVVEWLAETMKKVPSITKKNYLHKVKFIRRQCQGQVGIGVWKLQGERQKISYKKFNLVVINMNNDNA